MGWDSSNPARIYVVESAGARPYRELSYGTQLGAQTFSGSDNKTGIGDILLRTKYRFFDSELLNFAE